MFVVHEQHERARASFSFSHWPDLTTHVRVAVLFLALKGADRYARSLMPERTLRWMKPFDMCVYDVLGILKLVRRASRHRDFD